MRPAAVLLTAIITISGGLEMAPALPPAAAYAAAWPGLKGLRRVSVEVVFTPDHPQLAPEVVERRLEDVLLANPNAPKLDASSTDRLRLVVAVREVSSSDLRGFYLPMSGSYGIGTVRLAVERQVVLAGEPLRPGGAPVPASPPMPALVWQVERQARGPWRRSGAEIMALVDDLVATLVEDLRGD